MSTSSEKEESRFITLAIHTFNKAQQLKSLLDSEGIESVLQNVNLEHPEVSVGVRVRIHEKDLPFALRIVENPEIFSHEDIPVNRLLKKREILIPVDFSDHSHHATCAAFTLADRQDAVIHLLHTFVNQFNGRSLQLSPTFTYDALDNSQLNADYVKAHQRMTVYEAKLKQLIKQGSIPAVKFSTEIAEGLPEDLILSTAKRRSPTLIVMGTRGAGAKARELVGSVTAEVLDSCRFPVFTVPDKSVDWSPEKTPDVMMFVEFDQEDFIVLDILHRFLQIQNSANVTFVKIEKTVLSRSYSDFSVLIEYASQHYPECQFNSIATDIDMLLKRFSNSDISLPDLIVIPSKKKNVFSRLFNPGIAHRLLFHSDIPMMVIPV